MPQHAFVIFGGVSVKLLHLGVWPFGIKCTLGVVLSALILSSDNSSHPPRQIAVLKYSP